MKAKAFTLNKAIRASSVRYIVEALLGTDQTGYKGRVRQEKDMAVVDVERSVRELLGTAHVVGVVTARMAIPFEHLSYWMGDDIRMFGSVIVPDCHVMQMALADMAECLAELVLHPDEYAQVVEPIILNEGCYHYEEHGSTLSHIRTSQPTARSVLTPQWARG